MTSETVEQKIEQNTQQVQEKKEPIQNMEAQKSQENNPNDIQEQNWKKFREEREKERKAKELAEKIAREKAAEAEALKAAMESILNKPSPQSDHEEYEDEDVKIQKKVEQAIEARLRKEEERRKQQEVEQLPQFLNKTFGDFNQVCNTENLDYLEFHYPEVAQAYKNMPDSFDKWAGIYKAVKRFVPNTDSRKDQAKAEKNHIKPQSGSLSGVSQSGQATAAYKLDEQRKAENWARMQRALKGLS